MDGYYVWCPSMIRAEGCYHLFASRWPSHGESGQEDLSGYRLASEVVHAVSDSPVGPFQFESVALSGRGAGNWDAQMCHNPKILRCGDLFVLFYLGSDSPTGLRKIGIATARSPYGPWERRSSALELTPDANNPAPLAFDDGSIMLAFRDEKLRMHIARAPRLDGPYTITSFDIYPQAKLEDPDLFFSDNEYNIVMEDNEGFLTGGYRHGGHLVSSDANVWAPARPRKVYTHTVDFDDGTVVTFDRRERPELFSDTDGLKGHSPATNLLTGVALSGKSWCLVQPIAAV